MNDTLEELYRTVLSRKGGDATVSYTAKLFEKGRRRMAQKVGEEAVELGLAAVVQGKEDVISESADLLFHLFVLWADCEVTPAEVMEKLKSRKGISGIEEKTNRGE